MQPNPIQNPKPQQVGLATWWSKQVRWLKRHPAGTLRYALQGAFVAFIARAVYVHNTTAEVVGSGPSTTASVDALCPLGGLETLWQWITTGAVISKTHMSNLVLALGLIISLFVVGPAFCGWVCPFGTLQEWLFRLSRKVPFLRRNRRPLKVELPGAWEKRLRLMRYVVLAAVVGFSWYLGSLVFADYDPYRTLWSLGSDEVALAGLIVLGLVAVGSLFIERFWCRYLCPLGAFNGLLSKLSLVRIKREPASCTDCNLCTQACFASIDVAKADVVSDSVCSGCLSCVDSCPKPGALHLEVPLLAGLKRQDPAPAASVSTGAATAPAPAARGTARPAPASSARRTPGRWPRLVYGLAVPLVLLATIGAASATGDWQTTGSREVKVDVAGLPSLDNIKGWRTPKEVSEMFGIPLDVMYQGMSWPADFPPESQFKDLEEVVPDFSVDGVREWVKAYFAEQGITVSDSSAGGEAPAGKGKGESGGE